MLYVSRYSNPILKSGDYIAVSISVGAPRWPLGYKINGELGMLKPFGLLQIEDKDTYHRGYMERLNKCGLDKIEAAVRPFFASGKDIVLLCYEDLRKEDQWCHRTMFAEWWLEQTGEIINELPDPSPQPKQAKKAYTPIAQASIPIAQPVEANEPAEYQSMQMRLF